MEAVCITALLIHTSTLLLGLLGLHLLIHYGHTRGLATSCLPVPPSFHLSVHLSTYQPCLSVCLSFQPRILHMVPRSFIQLLNLQAAPKKVQLTPKPSVHPLNFRSPQRSLFIPKTSNTNFYTQLQIPHPAPQISPSRPRNLTQFRLQTFIQPSHPSSRPTIYTQTPKSPNQHPNLHSAPPKPPSTSKVSTPKKLRSASRPLSNSSPKSPFDP